MTGKDTSSTLFDKCQVPENEEKALRYLQDRVPLQNILRLVQGRNKVYTLNKDEMFLRLCNAKGRDNGNLMDDLNQG